MARAAWKRPGKPVNRSPYNRRAAKEVEEALVGRLFIAMVISSVGILLAIYLHVVML
ncbi:hypothetical protein IC762_30115 [Bradyrhizobium genosp. L]|uniref:hypothetical protein n=1 Tax=Bradyrhizobium genosp. L TaxID=83637 RepID=UPI0018A2508A|nr:hypothetical protein [Bradyrhizobium genosp. L]QPF83878.1 hypothetical protein IC762_30115 [Bradyrhizobium genosp. L]